MFQPINKTNPLPGASRRKGMKEKLLYPIAGAVFAASSFVSSVTSGSSDIQATDRRNAHDFTFQAIDGTPLPLKAYAGKVVLVVNTASLCGFTSQYADLQALWHAYEAKGLIVLGVPSNDFGAQEPGTAEEILGFCQGAYGVTFPLTEKVKVKGNDAHPFYVWARAVLGQGKAPKWNFHKYLISPEGRLLDAYNASVRPKSNRLLRDINAVLPSP